MKKCLFGTTTLAGTLAMVSLAGIAQAQDVTVPMRPEARMEAAETGLPLLMRMGAVVHPSLTPWVDEDAGPVAICFDPTKPPSPAIMDMINRSVLGALERYNQQGSRWPGSAGAPVTISWSFIPDGVNIPSGAGEPAAASNLFAQMDAKFGGNRAAWISVFQQCFDRWAAITGTSYVRVQFNGNAWDDGAAFGNGGAAGSAGLRGDVRIGGKNIDNSSGILAYNYYPQFGGDMVLDTTENWGSNTNNFIFLRNTVLHEHGHGLGLLHVCPTNGSKLMEPFLNTGFDGPQHDDMRGIDNLYGDAFESNNSAGTATNLGVLAPGGTFTPSTLPAPAVNNGRLTSIDVNGDVDYFRVNQAAGNSISITCAPVGLNYDASTQGAGGACNSGAFFNSLNVAALTVQIIAADGVTVLATNAAGVGATAQLTGVAVPAGNFFVRVSSPSGNVQSQLYNLSISAGTTPAPANDLCAGAQPVQVGQSVSGNNTGGLTDGSATCGFNTTRDLWYQITPVCSGTLVLDTCGSSFDTVLSVHTGCTGTTANQIACNDDADTSGPCPFTLQSYLAVPVTAGTNYKIRVAGYNNASGNIELNVGFIGPANDSCANAAPIATGGIAAGFTCGATNDYAGECGASQAAPDVWHSFTPSCSGQITINTCGSNYDTVLGLYAGSCDLLTLQSCNDDAGSVACPSNGLASTVTANVVAGQPYMIRVSGFAGSVGNYVLNVGNVVATNDSCANAPLVTNGTYTGSTCPATFSAGDGTSTCGGASTSRDVWYRWTAPCTGNLIVSACGSTYDTVVSVHTGTCGNLVLAGCDDDSGGNGLCPFTLQSYLSVPVTAGATYYVRVAGFNGASGDYVLSLDQQFNDRCDHAAVANVGANAFSTICATVDGTASCGFNAAITPDVWFNFTAPCDGLVDMNLCGSNYDTVLSVMTGDCGSLTEVACNDDGFFCPDSILYSRLSFNAVNGTAYKIRVSGYNTQTGSGTLNIAVTCACDPDLNQDGNVDQDDVAYLINVIGGGANPTGIDPDFNHDGNADQDDISALINVVAGGPCP